MEHLGHGTIGALAYVGGHELFFNHPAGGRDVERRSSFRSHLDDDGRLIYEVGLSFRVNGKPGEDWRMAVAYEPDDTYTILLFRASAPRSPGNCNRADEVLLRIENVQDDDLQHAVETLYDDALKTHANKLPSEAGIPPLSRPLRQPQTVRPSGAFRS